MQSHTRWPMLAGLWGLYFCFGLGFTGIAPLVPLIAADLGMSSTQMGMVLGSWQFTYILASIPAAFVIKRKGVGFALILAGFTVSLSLLLRSFSTDFPSLLFSVALLGIGGPIISIGSPLLVARHFEGKQMGFAMGLYITAPALANILTFSLSTTIVLPLLNDNWRFVLLLWSAISVIFLFAWLCIVRSQQLDRQGNEFNWKGLKDNQYFSRIFKICVMGALILFVDHGFRAWAPEIARAAGDNAEMAGILSAAAIGLGLIALLTIPAFIVDNKSRVLVTFVLTLLIAFGVMLTTQNSMGVAFVVGLLLIGFSTGPLLTIGLLPIVKNGAFPVEQRALIIAVFFAIAEIGGMAGPVSFGILLDYYGNFDIALGVLCVSALLINLPLLTRTPRPR